MPAYSRSARAARALVGFRAAVAPLAAALALCSLSPQASALSKRDQAAVDALSQRMQSAEARYQSALVKIRNADPTGRQDSDAALEDMEDVIAACLKQKGCAPSTMLAGYKRLLKANADSVANTDEDAEDAGQLDSDGLAADVPEAARAAALLSDDGQRFVKMVQYNPAVQAGIRRWLTDLRGPLMQSYDNYQYMRQLMWPEFQRAGLPEALLFGIMAKESNGRVHSTSRVGAAGPLQFMFATGKRFGLGDDGSGFDTRYDPKQSAQAAAEYLNERLGQLNNSIEMSLAAYNGGEGRALRINNASGGRNFWDESVYNQFPAETRDYVPMVVAAAWLFLHPREYGLNFPKVDSKLAQLRLNRPSSIYELTICMGGSGSRDGYMRALRNLNPRYQADSYLSAGTTLNATTRMVSLYNRWCVQGKRADLARTLVASDANSAIVRTGPLTVLPASNAGEDGTVAYAGTSAAAVPTTVATGRPAPAPKPEPKKKATPKDYKIQRGDTLTDVARKFSCDTRALAKANGLKAPRYAVKPGQRIKLSGCGD
ncbi:membrane-bound lytic murein transglycosylase D [Lysobacter enzymogenes]|uniref:transglycosylase SLT domain-containing protein n=1 Tax=Lysobacter enzymogenes TaxID=69 RepID=UPI0033964534